MSQLAWSALTVDQWENMTVDEWATLLLDPPALSLIAGPGVVYMLDRSGVAADLSGVGAIYSEVSQ